MHPDDHAGLVGECGEDPGDDGRARVGRGGELVADQLPGELEGELGGLVGDPGGGLAGRGAQGVGGPG